MVLYTRHGCHLCDEAKELLEMYREVLPTPIEVDIDADPALQARFTTCVPVVEIDGKIRFRGRVNAVLLRRLIAATPQRGDDRVELPGSAGSTWGNRTAMSLPGCKPRQIAGFGRRVG